MLALIALIVGSWFALLLPRSFAQEQGQWRLVLEPKISRAALVMPITSASRTEIAAAWQSSDGLELMTRAQFDALKTDWNQFSTRARTNSSADFAASKIEYVRNKKNVIEYAMIRSDAGLIASAVLAPEFFGAFKDSLGDDLLVSVPNRFVAYVFPKLASHYQEYGPMIIRAYRETAYAVSLEVFQLNSEGWKTIGVYEEP